MRLSFPCADGPLHVPWSMPGGGARNLASGHGILVPSADWPDLCVQVRQSPAGAMRTTQVLATVSDPQFQPEILRRVTGDAPITCQALFGGSGVETAGRTVMSHSTPRTSSYQAARFEESVSRAVGRRVAGKSVRAGRQFRGEPDPQPGIQPRGKWR